MDDIQKITGMVEKRFQEKGYGIVKAGDKQYFLHVSGMKDLRGMIPAEYTMLQFLTAPADRSNGLERAVNVEVI